MGLDIIEIALNSITDFIEFERLANEVLQLEGFSKIRPLGIKDDQGIDAFEEKIFIDDEAEVTVFQYTTQEYLTGKVEDTIKKLIKNKIKFNLLVIATNRSISAHRQRNIKQTARAKHKVIIDIIEFSTFHLRLSDLGNGLFYRHFPSTGKQFELIKQQKLLLEMPGSQAHETAMLRVSCALSFHDHSNQTRQSIFDHLTLTVFELSSKSPKRAEDLVVEYSKYVKGLTPEIGQIQASLIRLTKSGLIKSDSAGYVSNERTSDERSVNISKLNEATQSLFSDLIDEVEQISGSTLSNFDKHQIRQNIRSILTEIFRLFGLDIAQHIHATQSLLSTEAKNRPDLITLAKYKLSNKIGDCLITVLGQLFCYPDSEQAIILSSWCRAFLGAQLMQLDPTLNEFQVTHFKDKIFILDTDTVLEAMLLYLPQSNTIQKIISMLLTSGCNVIIPTMVVDECIKHAKVSERTYNYFGMKGIDLSPPFIDENVNNAFVRGYYYAIQNKNIPVTMSFRSFISNYFEPSNSQKFLSNVINNTLPKGVKIESPLRLLGEELPKELLFKLETQFITELQHARKAAYRNLEQIKELAKTDSQVYLLVYRLNQKKIPDLSRLMGGKAFLLTSTRRFIKVGNCLGLNDPVVVSPKLISSLLGKILGPSLDPTELIKLFENPFMAYAVDQSWSDVQVLVEAGINTSGKNITRLRWDIENIFNKYITSEIYKGDGTERKESRLNIENLAQLLDTAAQSGYPVSQETESLVREVEQLRKSNNLKANELTELHEKFEQLKSKIEEFGRRKQNYLNRISDAEED